MSSNENINLAVQQNQQQQQTQQQIQIQIQHQQQQALQQTLQPLQSIPPPPLTQQQIQQEHDDQRKDGLCNTRSLSDYLAQLLKDRKQLDAFPNVFLHVERLLEEEITNVRASLFSLPKKPRVLPPPEGPIIVLNDKVYVPVKEYPDFNFVGRLLGPRGLTAKQLEADTGCKIMVRGKGSMRNKEEEDNYRGKPNYEHLSDDLHILISVEDTENRAKLKLEHAVSEIKKILIPSAQGEDELKKRQLMELAIINGTYRDTSSKSPYVSTSKSDWRRRIDNTSQNNHVFTHTLPCIATKIRGYAPATLGAPLILSPSANVTPFENPSTHMILVPCGDCGNYATFTSSALLTDNTEKSPVNGLKEQRRIINANHINRSLTGAASKNGFRAN